MAVGPIWDNVGWFSTSRLDITANSLSNVIDSGPMRHSDWHVSRAGQVNQRRLTVLMVLPRNIRVLNKTSTKVYVVFVLFFIRRLLDGACLVVLTQ